MEKLTALANTKSIYFHYLRNPSFFNEYNLRKSKVMKWPNKIPQSFYLLHKIGRENCLFLFSVCTYRTDYRKTHVLFVMQENKTARISRILSLCGFTTFASFLAESGHFSQIAVKHHCKIFKWSYATPYKRMHCLYI